MINDANDYLANNPGWAISVPSWATTTPSMGVLFNNAITYSKGSCVLHILRYTLGDSQFFQVMQSYCADTNLRFGSAHISDFSSKVNTVTGQNYDWFFNQWIYTANHPVYQNKYYFENIGSGQWNVNFLCAQVQTNASFFKMPVVLKVKFSDSTETTMNVMNDANNQEFAWTFAKQPARFWFDPDDDILLKQGSTTQNVFYSRTWTGSVGTNWKLAGNWNPMGVPLAESVHIPSSVSQMPVINDPGMSCGSLTIDNGATLTVNPGMSLTAGGRTSVGGPSCLILRSDAGGTGSFIDNGTIIGPGTARVERYLANDHWHFISAPVNNALSGVFLNDYLITSDQTTTTGWGDYIVPVDVPLGILKGYAVWKPSTTSNLEAFTGTLNTGLQQYINIPRVSAAPWAGWNLCGNPYPSALDYLAAGWTKTNLDAAFYFWDPDKNPTGDYRYFNGTAGDHSRYIPCEQGFYIHISEPSTSGSLTVTNQARVHNAESFLKDQTEVPELLSLKARASIYEDETFIQFDQEATTGFDPSFDAYKLFGSEKGSHIYSSIAGNELAINVLPFTGKSTTVEVAFRSDTTVDVELTANGVANFPAGTRILLEDIKLNAFHDLVTEPGYHFRFEQSDSPNRFRIKFINSSFGQDEKMAAGFVDIFSFGHFLQINNNSEDKIRGELMLYDMSGRSVFNCKVDFEKSVKVELRLSKGMYISRLVTDTFVESKLVWID